MRYYKEKNAQQETLNVHQMKDLVHQGFLNLTLIKTPYNCTVVNLYHPDLTPHLQQ